MFLLSLFLIQVFFQPNHGLCDLHFLRAGMTNANMKLVILSVVLHDKMETPAAKPEVGEFIVTKVVELAKLKAELEGVAFFRQINRYVLTYGLSSRL
jgi:hypothetical protein